MNRRFLRLMMVVALLLVSGCANMNLLKSTHMILLEEYKQVRSWSAIQTENGRRNSEQRYAQEPSETNRLRLALVLGFGKGAATDTKRALQLFDASATSEGPLYPDEVLFAEVFGGILKERLQAEVRIGNVETKNSTAEAKVTTLNRQLDSERERANDLVNKLEALKSIEKSLRKR